MLLCRRPRQLHSRLVLKSCIGVVFQLGSQGKAQRVDDSDLVLEKNAEEAIGALLWYVQVRKARSEIIAGNTITKAPDDVVAGAGRQVVMEVDVEGMPALRNVGIVSIITVVVRLQRDIGMV